MDKLTAILHVSGISLSIVPITDECLFIFIVLFLQCVCSKIVLIIIELWSRPTVILSKIEGQPQTNCNKNTS